MIALIAFVFTLFTMAHGINNVTLVEKSYPFVTCVGAPDDLVIESLELIPDPPKKGSNVQMNVAGQVDEQLTDGASMGVSVFFDQVKIYQDSVDLGQLTSLPVGPGPIAVNYSVAIPGAALPGLYLVQLAFYDQTDTQIQCILLQFPL